LKKKLTGKEREKLNTEEKNLKGKKGCNRGLFMVRMESMYMRERGEERSGVTPILNLVQYPA
jgi:hypothetical protein